MKVVDLHPEDLLDKLVAGDLTPVERGRLDAHLAQCSVCRFEVGVRVDLERETSAFEGRPELGFPGTTERTRPGAATRVIASTRPRSRRRWPLSMLAAALVLCAGGAMAAVLGGAVQAHWLPWASETQVKRATAPSTHPRSTSKSKRIALESNASDEPRAIASAEESALPSPPASVAQMVGSLPLIASASSHTSPALEATPIASSNARAAASVSGASALPTPGAPNPIFDAPLRVADRASRPDPAAALFADANRARRDGNADRAVTLYRTLQSRYPDSAESALSRALLAQLLLDRGSAEAALAGFDRYLATEAPVLSAEALVGRARALEQLGKSAQAAAAWRDVQSRFPGSVHARLAATRLAALGMR